jgi:hypothetical protein
VFSWWEITNGPKFLAVQPLPPKSAIPLPQHTPVDLGLAMWFSVPNGRLANVIHAEIWESLTYVSSSSCWDGRLHGERP